MNERNPGLPENELEQVSGGAALPDTDENIRAWDELLRDLQEVLADLIAANENSLPRSEQRKLRDAYSLTRRCKSEVHSTGDPARTARELFHMLAELRQYPGITDRIVRLQELVF